MTQPLLKTMNAAKVLLRRREPVDPETLRQARVMLDDIALRGEAAVLEYARRFGDLDSEAPAGGPLERERLQRALDRLPARDRSVLERTADRIRDFADAQRRSLHDLTIAIPGGSAGHTLVPVSAAGCYAPGGRYPLPSSVLMTAVTARSAGVSSVWVASPRPTEATLAAAAIAGADGLLPIGAGMRCHRRTRQPLGHRRQAVGLSLRGHRHARRTI
jgi:histidinol dehydrogenase